MAAYDGLMMDSYPMYPFKALIPPMVANDFYPIKRYHILTPRYNNRTPFGAPFILSLDHCPK